MTITEKNLARKLSEAFDGHEWQPVIDIIKEVTGHEFAPDRPERPEPGAIGVVATGPREGYPAIVQQDGTLLMFNQYGDCYRRGPVDEWPQVTPARVIPEGESINPGDVRVGDRVRVVLDSGDEATFTVTEVSGHWFASHRNAYRRRTIRTVHLLHREGA